MFFKALKSLFVYFSGLILLFIVTNCMANKMKPPTSSISLNVIPQNTPIRPLIPTPVSEPVHSLSFKLSKLSSEELLAYVIKENGCRVLYTTNLSGREIIRDTSLKTQSWAPQWSPNGKYLAFLHLQNHQTNIFLLKKGTSQIKQLTFYSDFNVHSSTPVFSWSPSSHEIAYIYNHQIYIINIQTLASSSIFTAKPTEKLVLVSWDPWIAKYILCETNENGTVDHNLYLINLKKAVSKLVIAFRSPNSVVSWNSSGEIFSYETAHSIRQFSIENFKSQYVFHLPYRFEFGPSLLFSPRNSNQLLFVVQQRSFLSKWKLALVTLSRNKTSLFRILTSAEVKNAVWSPNGSKIAYIDNGNLWIMNSNGSNKHCISYSGIETLTWSKK
jgi:Tol biopolymer transport system component